MAKGLRSHIKQKHKTALRNSVFAPVIDARTERLSKKLQEIAAQPREAEMKDVNIIENDIYREGKAGDEEDMEVDDDDDERRKNMQRSTTTATTTSSSTSSRGIHKRNRKKSAKKSINFKPHPMKVKAKKTSVSKRK
ncbi:hypothetical protein KEM54_006954 [Ascosphaera aggregata]|nr:hypothetical protein KEM54_006954 [Ascosphaera aggregata]